MAVQPEVLDAYDDRRMVAAFHAGEDDAFSRIVETHYSSLLAEARRRLRSGGDAEDAVQETLLRAYLALDRFGGEYRLRAWLSRILANACTDAQTRRSGDLRLYDRLAQRRDEMPGADEELGDAELRRKVRDAVTSLPDSYRTAFVLREVEERSYAEVAEQMSVTEPNARARVHRARSSLARSLRDSGAALGGFLIPLRLYSPRWLTRGGPTAGHFSAERLPPRVVKKAAAAVRAGHRAAPLSAHATTAHAIKSAPLLGPPGRQTRLADISSLSQAAVSPATQAPLSSVSQALAQVAASPLSQTILAAAPDAVGRASLPVAGTLATLAAAGAAMIGSGAAVNIPQAAAAPAPATVTAAPSTLTPHSPEPSTAPAGMSASTGTSSDPTAASNPNPTSGAPGGAQAWNWVSDASSGVPSSSSPSSPSPYSSSPSSPSLSPSSSPSTSAGSSIVATACDVSQWFPGASTTSLPPPVPAGTLPSAFFASDTLEAVGENPAFVATGQGTFDETSGLVTLNTYYGACMAGTTAPGLGVNLSNPADPALGVLQLTGVFVSSQSADGQTAALYRGTATWIGGTSSAKDPVTFAAQVQLDEPSNISALRVAFFGPEPGLSGPPPPTATTPTTGSSSDSTGGGTCPNPTGSNPTGSNPTGSNPTGSNPTGSSSPSSTGNTQSSSAPTGGSTTCSGSPTETANSMPAATPGSGTSPGAENETPGSSSVATSAPTSSGTATSSSTQGSTPPS